MAGRYDRDFLAPSTSRKVASPGGWKFQIFLELPNADGMQLVCHLCERVLEIGAPPWVEAKVLSC